MSEYFIHDPFSWDLEPNAFEKISAERSKEGYSFYDWINFCDYLTTLNSQVVQDIVLGFIDFEESLFALNFEAESLAAREFNFRHDDEMTIEDSIAEEKALYESAQKWNRRFYSDVYPKLPRVNDYEIPQANRTERLISPEDYTSIGNFIDYVLDSGLAKFMEDGHGYPADFVENGGVEEWNRRLESYRAMLKALREDSLEFDQDVFNDFIKFFPSIWD